MKKKKPIISIIIVYYHAKKELFNCISSIVKSLPKTPYEIIVVDNDEVKTIEKELKKAFSEIVYVKCPGNYGFGAAVNRGVKKAQGEYLGLFNPDTIILGKAIDKLYAFIKQIKDVGIVSAVVRNEKKQLQEKQGAGKLTPLNAVVNYSIFSRIFSRTPLSNSYWIYSNEIGDYKRSFSVPLGWAIMRKDIYKRVGGFDEDFFLYYEDVDICKRVEEAGYRNYIYSGAEFIHLGGKGGTEEVSNINSIYKQSGFLYFRKHYGLLNAYATNMLLSISRSTLLIIVILCISSFVLFYNLEHLMSLNGEQGWYYLAARDMLMKGEIPLVGVPSSHPWLSQGAYWTYILAPIFLLTNFHPLAPGYFTAGISILTVFLIYKIGVRMFSANVGLIAAFLYATSPLVIIHARMPYHTSFIPLFTLFYIFALYKWLSGNRLFLPVSIFLLAVLYNFQISTTPFTAVLLLCLVYGFWKKKKYFTDIINKKILSLSFSAWLIPMLPMLIYDFHNGFPQTLKFILWIGYRVARLFGFPSVHGDRVFEPLAPFLPFTVTKVQQLVFLPNSVIAIALLLTAFFIVSYTLYVYIKKNKIDIALIALYLCFVIPFLFYFGLKTPSEAYWPMFFPTTALVLAVSFAYLMQKKRLTLITIITIIIIGLMNAYSVVNNSYLMNNGGYGPTYSERVNAAQEIIQLSEGQEYTIIGQGPGSQFPAFTMNYEYLTWWLGYPSTKNDDALKIQIVEDMRVEEIREITN